MNPKGITQGKIGAVSSGHALATRAALDILTDGGSAVDAAICAQAVICVVMPQAAGLGGDMLMLIRTPESNTFAINGVGRSSLEWAPPNQGSGATVTVPGIVSGWSVAEGAFGKLPLQRIFAPAIAIARSGFNAEASLIRARDSQRARLLANGASDWPLINLGLGDEWKQPELAALLEYLVRSGLQSFYKDPVASTICRAVQKLYGGLSTEDFASQNVLLENATSTSWGLSTLYVQPPSTQGVLLAMVAKWLDHNTDLFYPQGKMNAELDTLLAHLEIEVTEGAFQSRDAVISEGDSLLKKTIDVNLTAPSHRAGPRSYLHTAGVAVTDADGLTVSSLVSVFDDFGSAIYVPELGISLNNRADGFTTGANAYAPNAFPVHTLAPAILVHASGQSLALATPGADGQVQTLIQILSAMRFRGRDLFEAISAPRWRAEDGKVLIERTHPKYNALLNMGYKLEEQPLGSEIFGAVVATGTNMQGPYASADFRRQVTAGAR